MIVAIHQPNFIPWLGYFSKINQSDKFIILDTVDLQLVMPILLPTVRV